MSIRNFNLSLLLGWLLVLAGGVLVHPGWGLAVAGLLLLALTFLCVRIAGGLVAPAKRTPPKGEEA